eukprot:GHRR01003049.1.p1 GENE.GHRR01003049.1~~GHRR01003049.1.p1  ORF type:complete len:611 (+),score=194.39 GHRR01003049.1:731-2563(+)
MIKCMRHMPPKIWCFLLCLLTLSYANEDASSFIPGLDLTKRNFNQTLLQLPEDALVLMEFYASWCPACRAFKPEYEKVVWFLRGLPQGAQKVHALRLDCAIDPDVCSTYKVAGYPTMYTGTAADLLAVKLDRLTKFEYSKYQRTAPGVVQFVAASLNLTLSYADTPAPDSAKSAGGPEAASSGANSIDMQWTEADVRAATVQLFNSITSQGILHSTFEQRTALQQLLQVWAVAHPVSACKTGAATVLQQLPQVWPPSSAAADLVKLKTLQVCGAADGDNSYNADGPETAGAGSSGTDSSDSWVACRGTKPDGRGFTCGLWLLFHTTAARVSDGEGATLFMSSLKGFAHQFFQCQVCKEHFERIVDSPETASVRSRRDAMLRLWHQHNDVNARLAKIESEHGHSSSSDPAHPKQQWPSAAACPQCRLPVLSGNKVGATADQRGGAWGGRRTGEKFGVKASSTSSSSSSESNSRSNKTSEDHVQWNEEEVYRYLVKWYGGHLSSTESGSGSKGPVLLDQTGSQQAATQWQQSGQGSAARTMLGNLAGIAAVAGIAGAGLWWYGRSKRRRHAVKGPGMLLHKSHGLPKYGLVGGQYNGDSRGPRMSTKRAGLV